MLILSVISGISPSTPTIITRHSCMAFLSVLFHHAANTLGSHRSKCNFIAFVGFCFRGGHKWEISRFTLSKYKQRWAGVVSEVHLSCGVARVLRLFLCTEQLLRAEQASERCLLSRLQHHYHVMRYSESTFRPNCVLWTHIQQLASTKAVTQPEMQLLFSTLPCFPAVTNIRVLSEAVLWWSGSRVPTLVVSTGDRILCYVTGAGTSDILVIRATS